MSSATHRIHRTRARLTLWAAVWVFSAGVCGAESGLSTIPLPDLQIDYMTLGADNTLIVGISNQGRAEVPPGFGRLARIP